MLRTKSKRSEMKMTFKTFLRVVASTAGAIPAASQSSEAPCYVASLSAKKKKKYDASINIGEQGKKGNHSNQKTIPYFNRQHSTGMKEGLMRRKQFEKGRLPASGL